MMERFPRLYSGVIALWAISAHFAAPSASSVAAPMTTNGIAVSGTPSAKINPIAPVRIAKAKPVNAIPVVSEILPDPVNTQVTPDLSGLDDLADLIKSTGSETKTGSTAKVAATESAKLSLGDALISQNTLRIFLDRPVSISVFNARGQMVFHQDSQRQMETLPLQGMPTGFLYLTLRAGQSELSKKLLYTGK